MRGLGIVLAGWVALLAGAAAAQPERTFRIGYLNVQAAPAPGGAASTLHIIEEELARLGYVEGRNVVYERRYADGDAGRLAALASELVARGVDVIIAQTTTAALAAKRASAEVPIVFTSSGDAVGSGLVKSLAEPGGNATGNSFLGTELAAKQLDLLRELVPGARRVALVGNDALPPERLFLQTMREAGRALGLEIDFVDMRGPEDFPDGVARLRALGADAAIYAPGGYTDRPADRARLLAAGAARAVPALFFRREFVEAGALAAYGPSFPPIYRQAAHYVARILQGARPADLPVMQPTAFELVVNRKAAAALGLRLPDSILARADEVID